MATKLKTVSDTQRIVQKAVSIVNSLSDAGIDIQAAILEIGQMLADEQSAIVQLAELVESILNSQ